MFLRCSKRRKDGKEHLYWSVVENRRLPDQRVVRRHVLYLGELNGVQETSWRTASGLTPRAVLEKFAAVQMIDVHLPTTDGREIVMARHTQPEKDLQLLLDQLSSPSPNKAPPKIQALT